MHRHRGTVENSQVAVYLAYANPSTAAGCALIDRALYLPRSWTEHSDRCRAAGVPDQVGFATKPALARQMLSRALGAGAPAAWLTGDPVGTQRPRKPQTPRWLNCRARWGQLAL